MAIRVKICGITRYEDARTAIGLGVDAIGFIFQPKSPRYIAPVAAREIIRRLPPYISRVGVFVDEDIARVVDTVRFTGIDTLQLHGNEDPSYCGRFAMTIVKAFRIGADSVVPTLDHYPVNGFLLDTWDEAGSGGTGRTFDWEIAKRVCLKHGNVILAGGLGPTNLREAIEAVRPYGVDLNSGVEVKPGIKNPHKMRDAVRIARSV